MMTLKLFSDALTGGNSYLLYKRQEAVLIDPGFNGQKIIDFCQAKNIEIKQVILTHGHFDHIRDLNLIASKHHFGLLIHALDYPMLFDSAKSYAKAFGATYRYQGDHVLIDQISREDKRSYLQASFKILMTPGHTAGSICVLYQHMLFSGDTLFLDSIGRTDLFSGSQKAMHQTLKKLKEKLSDQTVVYPGHGPHGLFKDIKENNVFLR